MTALAEKAQYTPEDLLQMPDGDSYELVNGKLVELHVGTLAAWIAGELFRRVSTYCFEYRLGWVFAPADAGGYQGFPGSTRTVRKPDMSFVRYGRFTDVLPGFRCRVGDLFPPPPPAASSGNGAHPD
jgi:putative restriction endonuclease